MVLVTAAIAIGTAIAAASTFTIVTTVLSIGYQLYSANKQKKAAAKAAEARKGFEGTKKDTAANLPVIYGRNKIGSVITDYKTKDSYKYKAASGYVASNYSPASGFAYDGANYVEIVVEGTTGQDLSEEGQSGKDIVNITKVITKVVFSGVVIQTITKDVENLTLSSGSFLSTSFESLRDSTNAFEEGTSTYFVGDEHRISNSSYRFAVRRQSNIDVSTQVFAKGLGSSQSGSKNEFLFTQHAIAFAGVSRVIDINVDGKRWSDSDYNSSLRINTYQNGGEDKASTANFTKSTNIFTETFMASCVFKVNRDDPQYGAGIPNLEFFVEGQKVYDIEENNGLYGLSATKTYSNNPARVLLDYLMSSSYGRGLTVQSIDLPSFYKAKVACDTIVMKGATKDGKVSGGSGVTDIRLYEINHIVDTANPVRDNVTQILETMGQATLIWSGGSYKLNLAYPSEQPSVENGLVDASHVFSDDHIIKSDFSMSWPNAEDKFNQVTVQFPNSFNDFKSDSVSWPRVGSDAYNIYIEEDNYQDLKSSITPIGVTDPYHAMAKAEGLVRLSRSLHQISVTLSRAAILMEPGDFFILSSEALDVDPTVYRIESIQINSDLSVSVDAYYFDFRTLAWNINDEVPYPASNVSTEVVNPITNFSISIEDLEVLDLGKLTWDYEDDAGNGNYTYEVFYKKDTDSDYTALATTTNKSVSFQKLNSLSSHAVYDFKVRAKTPLGEEVSSVFLLAQTLVKSPEALLSLGVFEEIYITNNASGVKSRALLNWVPDNSGINSAYYLVEYKLASDSEYETLGTTASQKVTIPDVRHALYDLRVTPYSTYGFAGSSFNFQKLMVGLSSPPSTPENFNGNINEGQINLAWKLSPDLDVVYGGSCEIRFHIATDSSASWDTSSVLVDSLSGNTNNKTVPTLKGTFFIKFKDSSGIYSTNAAVFTSTFQDSSFNQIETSDESGPGFLGAKSNCSTDGTLLTLDENETEMTYEFNNYVDLGEIVTVRIYPSVVASVISRTDFVSGYDSVQNTPNFGGTLQDADLRVQVSTTKDDPSGSPVWTSYELLTVGSFTCRALRFNFVGVARNSNIKITLSELSIIVDKKDIVKVGSSNSSVSEDVTVTFGTPFYGGSGGTNSPSIGMMVIGGSQGDEIIIISRNKVGFVYSIYNSGSRVSRDIDWQAIGQ